MRKARVDRNQYEIVETLRRLGCIVCVTSSVGKGFPDLVASIMGRTYLLEIKDGNKWKSQQKLTIDQQVFHDNWRAKIPILKSIQDAIDFVDAVKVEIIRQNRYNDQTPFKNFLTE